MNVERNQITISLDSDYYWLSIVECKVRFECKSDDYHIKELALVRKSPSDFLGISLVPLRDWYGNASWSEEHVTVNLLSAQAAPESFVLSKAIVKAQEYLSLFRGQEFVVESVEQENN